jgi:hypothetical protein
VPALRQRNAGYFSKWKASGVPEMRASCSAQAAEGIEAEIMTVGQNFPKQAM